MGRILKEKETLFNPVPKHVVLFYQEDQELYKQFENEGLITHKTMTVPTYEEMKDLAMTFKSDGGSIFIFDDALTLLQR